MKWDFLPKDIINKILYDRKVITSYKNISLFIQKIWRAFRIKILINRFKTLNSLKEFKIWNPNIQTFLIRSKL